MSENAAKEMSDFERWMYAAKDPATDMPVITVFLYEICSDDQSRFERGCDILEKAFEAGARSVRRAIERG